MSDDVEPNPVEAARERERQWRREYRVRNAVAIKAYATAYREEHREEIRAKGREYMRGYTERKQVEAKRREERREYSREYYAKNRDAYLEQQRALRQKRREENPDRYRELARNRNKRWRDANKDAENAKLRDKYRVKGSAEAERKRAYYQANKERITALKRARYAANRDEQRAYASRYRANERRRHEAGLPPKRLHHPDPEQVALHEAEANAFFARRYRVREIDRLRAGPATPPELIGRWKRDSLRVRAAAYQASAPDAADRTRVAEARRLAAQMAQARSGAIAAAEEARLDAIARAINDRLRTDHRQPLSQTDAHAFSVTRTPSKGAGL